jgi:hypothetical protein
MPDDPLQLEDATARAQRPPDAPRMPEPPPVKLIAVEDIRLPCIAGAEVDMDTLYLGVLSFEKESPPHAEGVPELLYRAENFRLIFSIHEGLIQRHDYRPLQVEVPSLREAEHRLIDREIEYSRQRGLTPGSELLVLVDPSGNYLEIAERREVR